MKKIITIFLVAVAFYGMFTWIQKSRIASNEAPSVLIIGTSADFQPFSFKDNDTIVGFDIDIITEVCKRLEKPFVIKDMPFEMLIPQIQLGAIHVLAAGMTVSPKRADHIIFTKPHIVGETLIALTRQEGPVLNSLEDLQGKTVAVPQGYTYDVYISQIPGVTIRRLSSVADCLLALKTKAADALVSSHNSLKALLSLYASDNFNIYSIEEVSESVALGISKTQPQLAAAIQEVLTEMEADGTTERLKEKWHVQ